MNPFRFLDDLLGPLDAISVGVGTAKMLAMAVVPGGIFILSHVWRKLAGGR